MAVLCVLFWHAYVMPLDQSFKPAKIAYSFLFVTRSGVDLFFVLSGFLITGILLRHSSARNYFSAFYTRRFFRIAPLYYLLVLVIILSAWADLDSSVLAGDVPIASYICFLQNYFSYGHTAPALLAVTWSLAIEEQFYITFPLLVKICRREKLPALFAGLIVCAVITRWQLSYHDGRTLDGTYVWTICRLDSLLIGSLIAYAELITPQILTKIRSATGKYCWQIPVIIFLSGPLIVQNIDFHMARWGYLFYGILYGVLLINALEIGNPVYRWLTFQPLIRTGTIAYGLYLIHWPLLYTIMARRGRFANVEWCYYLAVTLALAVAYLIALISYHSFELYLLRRGRQLGQYCD